MSEYTFPINIDDADKFPVGKRIAEKDRNGQAVSGLVVRVKEGNRVALVTIEVDAREL